MYMSTFVNIFIEYKTMTKCMLSVYPYKYFVFKFSMTVTVAI